MNWPRFIVAAGLAVSLGLSAYYLLGNKYIRAYSPLGPLYGKADLKMKKLRLEEKKDNQRHWRLEADMAESYSGKGLTFLKNVRITFFQGSTESYIVTGNMGTLDNRTYSLALEGDVRVEGPGGFELLSPTLMWDAPKGIIKTEDAVDLKRDSLSLKGRGLTSTPDLGIIKINGSIRAEIEM